MPENYSADPPKTWGQWSGLIALGLAAGFLSGMFGVGGGILIVPGLVALAHFTPARASGTSLAAIVPLAAVGVISYAMHNSVAWLAALFLAIGAMAGSKLGTLLLTKIKARSLQIVFSLFMVVVIVSMFLVVPARDADLKVNVGVAVALLVVGLATGTLSGLLGVGGGVIVVPALMVLFGANDLVAKGTSLLVMIPSALAGTFFNFRSKNVDLPAAAAVGLPACATTYFGSLAAVAVPVHTANLLFAIFLALVAIDMFVKAIRSPKG